MKQLSSSDASRFRQRTATARAIRVLRYLQRLGVKAVVVGSLAEGRFHQTSDVDFLILECPHDLIYRIEARIEDIMLDIPFDAIYGEESRPRILARMQASAKDARALLKVAA